jgi:hypothetical protein
VLREKLCSGSPPRLPPAARPTLVALFAAAADVGGEKRGGGSGQRSTGMPALAWLKAILSSATLLPGLEGGHMRGTLYAAPSGATAGAAGLPSSKVTIRVFHFPASISRTSRKVARISILRSVECVRSMCVSYCGSLWCRQPTIVK